MKYLLKLMENLVSLAYFPKRDTQVDREVNRTAIEYKLYKLKMRCNIFIEILSFDLDMQIRTKRA